MADEVAHWLLMGCFQPETLSKSTLTEILKKRNICKSQVENSSFADKKQLCRLYHRYLMPQPQRKYENSRRGRRMSQRQLSCKKRKIPDKNPCENVPSKKLPPNLTRNNIGNETKADKILSPTSKGLKSTSSTQKTPKNKSSITNDNDYDKDSKRRKITWP